MKVSSGKGIILKGYVVNESGRESQQKLYVSINEGKIISITESSPHFADDYITVELSDSQVIFPGFLDLHTHIEYNMIPNWDSDYAPWDNRHEWRNNNRYLNDISNVRKYLEEAWGERYNIDFRMLGEIQAIAGGTTVLQETEAYREEQYGNVVVEESEHVLIRSTGRGDDVGLDRNRLIFSVIDFFKPNYYNHEHEPNGISGLDTSSWIPVEQIKYEFLKDHMKDDLIDVTLVHLAEGRTGYLRRNEGADAYSRNEFVTFMNEMKKQNPEDVKKRHIALIHGCGVDSSDREHIDFLKTYGISILWAPISNTLLYGDTLNVYDFIDNGVNVALGSDWSPSGGKHVWEEAKFAYSFCSRFSARFGSNEALMRNIYKMITINAAKCLSTTTKLGRVAVNSPADLVIMNRMEGKTALETLFHGNDDSITAVLINGRITYGNRGIFEGLKLNFGEPFYVDYQNLPESDGKYAANKCVSINKSLQFDLQRSTNKLETLFQSEHCPRKWQRSKYLASDDLDYQERIRKLKHDLHLKIEQMENTRI